MNGGPAFPVIPPSLNDRGQTPDGYPLPDAGMTLRDYFAGQALAGLYANDVVINQTLMAPKDIVAVAYEAADAMLKARSR